LFASNVRGAAREPPLLFDRASHFDAS